MAELDLIPKLPVLAVQTGVFLANLAIVKKLFVEPYFIVREARERLTFGSRVDAGKYTAESESLAHEIDFRLSGALQSAKKEREKSRAQAMEDRQKLIDAALGQSRLKVQQIEKSIKYDLEQEKSNVPAMVKKLTDEIYQAVLR